MMRMMIAMAATALTILVCVAPAAEAETGAAMIVGTPVIHEASVSGRPMPQNAAPVAPTNCSDAVAGQVFSDVPAGCIGVPICASNSQCDSWCFPMVGRCISGCCACTF